MNQQQKDLILNDLRIGLAAQMYAMSVPGTATEIAHERMDIIRAAIKELEAMPTTEEV